MAKVSVIIPVYNVESYLRECMDSVINQTLEDLEIICVNDGSTDNSRAILQEYANKDSRIKIIDKENGGLSSARNAGIKMATGDFIGFVDSDDWIDLNFYEKLYDAAIQYDADIACGDIYIPETKKYYLKNNKYKYTEKVKNKFKYARIPKCCYVWNKIYNRKSLLKTKVFFADGKYYEDMEYTHKILYYLRGFITVPNVKYNYRSTPTSIVRQVSDKHHYDCDWAIRSSQAFVKSHYLYVNFKDYHCLNKIIYKILGVPVLVIKSNIFQKKYYLFGCLEIFHKIEFAKD